MAIGRRKWLSWRQTEIAVERRNDHVGGEITSERVPDPCIVVIFGASGDLTKRKLLPALFHLEQQGLLAEGLRRGGRGAP